MASTSTVIGSLQLADGKAVIRMEDRFATDARDLWSALTDPGALRDGSRRSMAISASAARSMPFSRVAGGARSDRGLRASQQAAAPDVTG